MLFDGIAGEVASILLGGSGAVSEDAEGLREVNGAAWPRR